jgi:N-acetylglucosaminyl-diphospho-decaprenol L-rhamnosyltransferase
MRLSVIVVNWNTGELIRRCVESVYADLSLCTDLPAGEVEVFIVDSASTDGSTLALQAQYPQATYIFSPQNIGFGPANNLALRQASGEFILLLNPDTLVHPGAIESLLRFMEQYPDAGAAASRLLNPDGSLQHSCSPEPTLKGEFMRLFHLGGVRPDGYYPMETWDQASPRLVDVILGACMMLRKSVLDRVGLFDEQFFMYNEETDLCRRIRLAGWKIYWTPQAAVTHYGGQSTRQMAAEMFVQLYRAKIIYFRKYHSPRTVGLYKLVLFMIGLPRLALAPVARLEPSGRSEKHRAIAANYQRLIRELPGL